MNQSAIVRRDGIKENRYTRLDGKPAIANVWIPVCDYTKSEANLGNIGSFTARKTLFLDGRTESGGTMQWAGGRRSGNIEDRRGMSIGALGGLGGLVVLLIALFFGVDPSALMNTNTETSVNANNPADAETKDFVSTVLGSTEDTWSDVFARSGGTYREPKLVLFSGAIDSACGFAQAAMGPFYCPSDEKVYLDMSFFQELRNRFQSPGDFAEAYVVAHEVGHHVIIS